MIGGVGWAVFALDVEPDTDDGRIGTGGFLDISIERAENALAAGGGGDVDALDPPKPAVAPVAPFERDADLADDLAVALGDQVTTFVRSTDRPDRCNTVRRSLSPE